MTTPKLTEELDSPRLYAIVIGVSGATFGTIIFGLIGMIVASFTGATPAIFFVHVAAATVVSFFLAYLYGLARWYRLQLRKIKLQQDANTSVGRPENSQELPEEEEEEYEDEEGLGNDFVKIPGKRVRIVKLTDGITIEHLRQLAQADLDAVSQRAVDRAGVLTRDPGVEVNAKVLVDWLKRNGFVELQGNSRYKYTPLGDALLESVVATSGRAPTTTTLE